MTIELITNRIIKDIKAWPEEARQSQDVGGPKTSWDEYKEQIQYEEYDSFEVFEETIESMISDEISELSVIDIDSLYRSIHPKNLNCSTELKREVVMNEVLSAIKIEAESQAIEYNNIDVEYVKYTIGDLPIVAKILSKVGPEEFLIQAYSEATGINGEQGVANISDLADEHGFERISPEEFDCEKQRLDKLYVFTDQAKLTSDLESFKNEARIKKGLQEFILLVAKATQKTPKEVLMGMKEELNKRKLERESQSLNLQQENGEPGIKFTETGGDVEKGTIRVKSKNPIKFDPKTMHAGIMLSGFHIEAGARSFVEYARAMVVDIGPGIKPYLKMYYNAIRDFPGLDPQGMDDYQTVSNLDIEKITTNF